MANIIKDGTTVRMYYSPPRKLKNSVGSSPEDGGDAVFPAEAAGIPDKFATTEHPKLKFLFSVQFFPRTEDFALAGDDYGSTDMNHLIFPLRRATRPNISATYQNVNFYNYRTQIQTKIEYGTTPCTLAFYDDISNRALGIMLQYLNSVSPISNMTIDDAANLKGLSFDQTGSASVGPLVNSAGPLAAIRIAHHSFNPENPQQLQSVYYDYINPKIITYTLDDLDMTTSDVTNVEMSFAYDAVNITIPDKVTGTVTVGDTQNVGGNPTASQVGSTTNNLFTDNSNDFSFAGDSNFNGDSNV